MQVKDAILQTLGSWLMKKPCYKIWANSYLPSTIFGQFIIEAYFGSNGCSIRKIVLWLEHAPWLCL